jgi:hypothetical protein
MLGVLAWTNAPIVSAYEAHIMTVTANIVDDTVTISPSGETFCNDGSLKVQLTTALSGATISYTTDGSNPVCGQNGNNYTEPFTLTSNKTVKAASCHDNRQSLVTTRNFNVSYDYCDKTSLKINKIFSNVDVIHKAGASDEDNEWVEIYNPTAQAINIKDWKICDGQTCESITSDNITIANKGYAVITSKETTWKLWNIPAEAIKVVLGSAIGDGLNDSADMIQLRDNNGNVIDQANWGTANPNWKNYNSDLWSTGFNAAGQGVIKGRLSNGYDNNSANDWLNFELPNVTLTYPNGGEIWVIGNTYNITWTATNSSGSTLSDYGIDLYYSKDSGATWANIIKNTNNNGSYSWRLPLYLAENGSNYFSPTNKARIKVVATNYAKNFMISNFDISDRDFCPPVDVKLLTAEEKEVLKNMDTTGIEFVNNGAAVAESAAATGTDSGNSTNTETKTTEILNKDNKDYLLGDPAEKDSTDKDSDKTEESTVKTKAPEITATALPSAPVEPSVTSVQSETPAVAATTATVVAPTVEQETSPIAPETDVVVEFNLNA